MKLRIGFSCCIFFIALMLTVSCKKETSCEGCATKNNKPPISIAGPDQVITLPTDSASLDGRTSSDPDGMINSYLWTKISGPASFTINRPSDSITKVRSLIAGIYQFELKVTDNGGLLAKDTMRVIVDLVLTTNHPPIANAGIDQIITLPTNAVNLDGSASTDPENNITTYAWTKISGPSSFNIANLNAVQTQLTNLIQGVYQFELKVTDAGGLFSKDTVQVIVQPSVSTGCDTSNRPLVTAQLTPTGILSRKSANMNIVSAGNKILFTGGHYEDTLNFLGGFASRRVDLYDIVTQTWSTAELSIPRKAMAAAVSGTKVVFAGGGDHNDSWFNKDYATVDIYDASTNTWTIDSLSTARWGLAGQSIGNKVFFAGGYNGYYCATLNVVDVFDLTTNSWSTTSLSADRYFLSAETIGNKIYFAGGDRILPGCYNGSTSNRIDIYDNTTSSWSTSTLIEPKAAMASIAHNGKIYWAGGRKDFKLSNLVEIYEASTQTSSQACLFQPNGFFTAVKKSNKIIFFTGEGSVRNKFDIYDVATNTWSIGVLNKDVYGAAIICVNNVIYVAGGYVNGVISNQVWKLEF